MHFSEKDTMKLKQAFEEYNSEMLSDLPTEDRLKKIFFSPRFEKKMKKLINGQKRHFYQIADTAAKRAACISVILFAVALFGAELSHAPITGSLSGSDYQGSMGGISAVWLTVYRNISRTVFPCQKRNGKTEAMRQPIKTPKMYVLPFGAKNLFRLRKKAT